MEAMKGDQLRVSRIFFQVVCTLVLLLLDTNGRGGIDGLTVIWIIRYEHGTLLHMKRDENIVRRIRRRGSQRMVIMMLRIFHI